METNQENTSYRDAVYIASLINKVRENETLTGQEQQDLIRWKEAHPDLFEQLKDRKRLVAEVKELENNGVDEAYHVLLNRLGITIPHKVHRMQRAKRWLSVAAVFLVLVSGAWFLLARKNGFKPGPSFSVRIKNDVMPGGDGAVLTLSDGRKIILDSAGNGSLTQQGDAEIIKKDGRIAYNSLGGKSAIVYNTMTTLRGRQYSLVLADGSKVWLNAASSITYPTGFSGSERKVTITGEAYFEVAHNDKMPFVVQRDDMSVLVLGTHFNVNTYDDENAATVTLIEGTINVASGKNKSLLKPGQQAQLNSTGAIKVIDEVDLGEVMAWKNGLFSFDGIKIEPLMKQIARWYDVEVVYTKKMDDLFHVEVPRNTKLSDVLKVLELTDIVQFKVEGKKVTVMPKK